MSPKLKAVLTILLVGAFAAAVVLWNTGASFGSLVLFHVFDFPVKVLTVLFWVPAVILSHAAFSRWESFNKVMGGTPVTRFLVILVFLLGLLVIVDWVTGADTVDRAQGLIEAVSTRDNSTAEMEP